MSYPMLFTNILAKWCRFMRSRVFVFLTSVACAAIAFVSHWFAGTSSALPAVWSSQLDVLLGLSVSLSALLLLFGSAPQGAITLLLVRFLPLAVIGLAEGAAIALITPLACAYVIEIVRYAPVPLNRVLTLALLLASVSLLLPVHAWAVNLPRPSVAILLAFWLPVALVAVLADLSWKKAVENRHLTARISKLEDTILQLTSANIGFQRYADTIQEKTAAEERNRITREIHDTVGYTLINIIMMLEEASTQERDPPFLRQLLVNAREQAQSGLNETRRALRLLRSSEPQSVQTIDEIKRLVTAFQSSTGVAVTVEYGNMPFSLGQELNDVIFHMLQEGMANALGHGKATGIRILFWLDDSELIVNIHDNGNGSAHIHEGIGLAGMHERTAALHGTLSAGNAPGGFLVTARIPYSVRGQDR